MNIPQHIVLFPDGNRRWAREKGLNTLEGHMQGYKNLLDFSKWCKNKGVKVLTAFGFSTENWNRSPEEVSYLMNLLEKCLIDNLESYNKNGTCVRVIGQKDRLPKSLQDAIIKTEESTKNNSSLFLNLAISYGGKWDILNAVKKIVEEKISVDDINEKLFDSYLSTAGLKDPDLVIRAGGEMRMSNYSELYFSSKYWPDFTEQDLDLALQEFDKRSRRFGK